MKQSPAQYLIIAYGLCFLNTIFNANHGNRQRLCQDCATGRQLDTRPNCHYNIGCDRSVACRRLRMADIDKKATDRISDKHRSVLLKKNKGTHLRDFASIIGSGNSALYRYYESPEAIRNTLPDRMKSRYAEHVGIAENMPGVSKSCEETRTKRKPDFEEADI